MAEMAIIEVKVGDRLSVAKRWPDGSSNVRQGIVSDIYREPDQGVVIVEYKGSETDLTWFPVSLLGLVKNRKARIKTVWPSDPKNTNRLILRKLKKTRQ